MIHPNILREVMLENREEVMRHEVSGRDVSLDDFNRQVLVGVRRCGKSYMLYGKIQRLIAEGKTWDEIVYINFEDERLADMRIEDLNKILEVHASLSDKRPALFLDEIQNVDGWEKFARRLADSKYTVYITGSNAKMLSVDVASRLGGRYMTKEIFPFSFGEFLRMKGCDASDPLMGLTTSSRGEMKRHFEEYFQFGGFPECALLHVKRDYLISLYQKIFLGDIAARHGVENIFALRILFRKLSESVMQPISYSRAANIVASTGAKVGKATVINYLRYAQEAYLILPISNIADKFTEKNSNLKYYFIDNGIISLLALDIRTALLENMVALRLMQLYGTKDAVYYYNHGIEVDFYLPQQEVALQVSYTIEDKETFDRETRALVKLNSSDIACRRSIIVTYEDDAQSDIDGIKIEVIPAWKFLLMKEL